MHGKCQHWRFVECCGFLAVYPIISDRDTRSAQETFSLCSALIIGGF